jgi:hypothetical protein
MIDRDDVYTEWRARPLAVAGSGEMLLGLGLYLEWTEFQRAVGLVIGPFIFGVEWVREWRRIPSRMENRRA